MLGFRPYSFYFYMWKFVSPAILVVLIVATVIEMAVSPAGYNAWIEAEVSKPPEALVRRRTCDSLREGLEVQNLYDLSVDGGKALVLSES